MRMIVFALLLIWARMNDAAATTYDYAGAPFTTFAGLCTLSTCGPTQRIFQPT